MRSSTGYATYSRQYINVVFVQAKAKLNQLMSNVIVPKIWKENILSELEDNDRFDIFEAAIKHKASVTFNYM